MFKLRLEYCDYFRPVTLEEMCYFLLSVISLLQTVSQQLGTGISLYKIKIVASNKDYALASYFTK